MSQALKIEVAVFKVIAAVSLFVILISCL